MEDIKIRIELDPVRDGIIQFPGNPDLKLEEEIKNRKAIVIGTDGNFRVIDTAEMERIYEGMEGKCIAAPLGDDYVMCFSSDSVIDAEFTKYLVGSAMVLKIGNDSRIRRLTDIDIKKMRILFDVGTITLVYGKTRFGAYPLELDDVA